MDSGRPKFAGGDQRYLRDQQYADATRLTARGNLHARYSTSIEPWFTWVTRHVDLRPGARVVEAGCGPGWLWTQGALDVPPAVHLTLTDLSPGMVAEAVEAVTATNRFDTVDGQPADLQDLPFDDAAFDRVVANHMLYHLPDPPRGIAELARVTRPDGRVVVATNGRRHMRELGDIVRKVFGESHVDGTVAAFGVEVGFIVLREHFSDVAWHAHRDELACSDPDDVIAYLCSVPPGEDATDDERARIVELVHQRFAAGDGVMRISKDTGCFVCSGPLVVNPG